MLVTNNALPATKLSEFADHVKANAGKLTNGNAGVGSTSHLACLLLNNRIGTPVTLVPYRGTGPALQDVVSGQVSYLCDQVTSLMSQVQAKTVKPLAVLAPTRSPVLPDVPTASEAGMSGIDMVVWNAVFAPKGTPPEIVEKLNSALLKAITDPASREKFLQLGAEPPLENKRSPQALRQIHAADVAKWGEVIRGANIKVE
jgi:tripartite-type tricarboxylate transporter receptor subunit TctC